MKAWTGRTLVALGGAVLCGLVGLIAFGYWFGHADRAVGARATMRTDLQNLAYAESLFYARHRRFTSVPDSLRVGDRPFRPSESIRLYLTRADSNGWHAVVSNAWTDEVCRMTGARPGAVSPDSAKPICR